MQTNIKENRAVGAARLDEENGGKQFSNPIVPPNKERGGPETMAAVLARVYRLVLEANEGGNDKQ